MIKRAIRTVSFPIAERNTYSHLAYLRGLDNIPPTGPVIIVPNHRSYFDHYLVSFTTRLVREQPTWFLTKKESFENLFRRIWTEAWFGIPVDRESMLPATVRQINDALAAGDAVCIYPEGTRNPTEAFLEFKNGAFRFAANNKVPILPAYISESERVLPRGSNKFFPGRATIEFGTAILPTEGLNKVEMAERLKTQVLDWLLAMRDGPTPLAASRSLEFPSFIHRKLDELAQSPNTFTLTQTIYFLKLIRLVTLSGYEKHVNLELYTRLAGLLAIRGRSPAKYIGIIWFGLVSRALGQNFTPSFWSHYLIGRSLLAKAVATAKNRRSGSWHLEQAVALAEAGDTRASVAIIEAEQKLKTGSFSRLHLETVAYSTDRERWGEKRINWALNLLEEQLLLSTK